MSVSSRIDSEVLALPLLEELGVLDAWVLNTYSGCDIRCAYCITGAQGRSVPRFPRERVADRLREELEQFDVPPSMCVGAFVDVYPNVEAHDVVTRPAIEVLVERAIPFTLVTKGATVLRDADLLAARRKDVEVQISLCSIDEDAIRRLDVGAPSAAERLEVARRLVDAGVRVRLQASPWIPGVTDLLAILDRLDPRVPVTTTPLRLPPHVKRTPFGREMDQRAVNDAFRQEYERIGEIKRLLWSRPPAEDGAPPHISDNHGTNRPDEWSPAPRAPDPGGDPDEVRRRNAPVRVALLQRAKARSAEA